MKITLNYFAQARRFAGVETETVDLPCETDLVSAVKDAASRHGDEFRALVLDGERIRHSLIALINGVPVARETSRPLKDGDVVSLMGAVAGG